MAGDLRLIGVDSLRALLDSYAATLEHEQVMRRLFRSSRRASRHGCPPDAPSARDVLRRLGAAPGEIDFERLAGEAPT